MLRLSFNVVRESYWVQKYKCVFCSRLQILHRFFSVFWNTGGLVMGAQPTICQRYTKTLHMNFKKWSKWRLCAIFLSIKNLKERKYSCQISPVVQTLRVEILGSFWLKQDHKKWFTELKNVIGKKKKKKSHDKSWPNPQQAPEWTLDSLQLCCLS